MLQKIEFYPLPNVIKKDQRETNENIDTVYFE